MQTIGDRIWYRIHAFVLEKIAENDAEKGFTSSMLDANHVSGPASPLMSHAATGHTAATLGNTLYAAAAGVWALLAGNTTTTRKFYRQTGTGTLSAAPDWDTLLASDIPASLLLSGVPFIIDGGGVAITTGQKGHIEVPFACTITGWRLLADQSGSIVVDIWKDTYANYPPTVADTITGSEKPTLASAQKNEDLALTTWAVTLNAGDMLAYNVDSVSNIQRVLVSLKVTRT